MKLLKYLILALFIVNIPSAGLTYLGGTIGSILSYVQYILLLVYYFLSPKRQLNFWMILLGISYFTISGIQYDGQTSWFINNAVKYFIAVVCGYEVIKDTSSKELTLFLFIGAFTIALHALVLGGGSAEMGRYSGFYLNPNGAAFICSSGYAASFSLKDKRLQTLSKVLFTIMGLLTLSRTFIATWLILNLISVKIDFKNIRIFVYGFILVNIFFLISQFLSNRNPRVEQLMNIVQMEEVDTQEIGNDSRDQTWAQYYDDISERFVFGNGYDSFNIKDYQNKRGGVHNTFLLILGEGGVFPFIIIVLMYTILIVKSIIVFKFEPHFALQLLVLILFLMAAHIYFTHHFIIFISMWIQYHLTASWRDRRKISSELS